MSSADLIIALGLPAIVAGIGLFALVRERRRQAHQARLIRQSVELRLAFGAARAELFRLAVEGVVDFDSDIYRALYALDTKVMRDLDSHTGLAVAITDVVRRRDAMPAEQAEAVKLFAHDPATAACARLHADALTQLWMEHSVVAQRMRMVPAWLLPLAFKLFGAFVWAVEAVSRWIEPPVRIAEEQRTRPKVQELVHTLDAKRPPLDFFGVRVA